MKYDKLTKTELEALLEKKEKQAENLSAWLSKHDNSEPEYKRVWQDRTELNQDIETLKLRLKRLAKPLERSLNESFEL
ncbi:MAG: hypothetical protein LCH37_13115 [Bacteroidetes bacterium]|nr:hypothetical protein [Bacteroidota bacterium]